MEKEQTNYGYKYNETTHFVKTFIYELDVSYAPASSSEVTITKTTIKFKHED